MELPPWLKIENIIGNLRLSGWFKGWFKFGNRIETNTTNNYNIQIILPVDANGTPEIIRADDISLQVIKIVEKPEFEFTDDQKYLIDMVNKIHALNNYPEYDFENDYKQALLHIKNKGVDWHVNAASHMANAMQSGGVTLGVNIFFQSFKNEDEPQKIARFDDLKVKIKYCYERLQNIRHVDKSGELKERMITEYNRKIYGQDTIPDQDYQIIFIDFQNFLLELFRNYQLK